MCNQDCNQGRNCSCVPPLLDKRRALLATAALGFVAAIAAVVVVLLLERML